VEVNILHLDSSDTLIQLQLIMGCYLEM